MASGGPRARNWPETTGQGDLGTRRRGAGRAESKHLMLPEPSKRAQGKCLGFGGAIVSLWESASATLSSVTLASHCTPLEPRLLTLPP